MKELLIISGALLLWWLYDCWRDPFRDCPWCGGSSKRRGGGRSRRTFHFCAVPRVLYGCGGSGRVRRLGSMLIRVGLGRLD